MCVGVGVRSQAATQTDEVILATQCHKWQITEGVLVWVWVCACRQADGVTLVQGERMTLRKATDRKTKGKREGLRWWWSVCFVLRVGQGIAVTTSCVHFLCSHTRTHLHGALTLRHNEQGLARGRRSKVFPVTWAAASTQRCSSGTRPAWVCRADFIPPPSIRLH